MVLDLTQGLVYMGWYVALLIKDCRYFCCSSKINLMKGKLFLVSFRHSEEVCEIGAFVFAVAILSPFWQLSSGLSIKSTHEIEWSKVTRWRGTEKFREKSRVFCTEWQMGFFFYLLTFNFRADIMTKYNFNQVRWFLTFSIDFMV